MALESNGNTVLLLLLALFNMYTMCLILAEAYGAISLQQLLHFFAPVDFVLTTLQLLAAALQYLCTPRLVARWYDYVLGVCAVGNLATGIVSTHRSGGEEELYVTWALVTVTAIFLNLGRAQRLRALRFFERHQGISKQVMLQVLRSSSPSSSSSPPPPTTSTSAA